jgi:deoxyribodipyrimidine photolyase-related protein
MSRKCSIDELTVNGRVGCLAVFFGDQLDIRARAVKELDQARDAILMMEVASESTDVPSHKQRTTLFFSATRHFARDAAGARHRVHYVRLDDPANGTSTRTTASHSRAHLI